MRYIRFLKTPRIVTEKGTSKTHVYCLVTITSDLGDSFFPYDSELSAELISPSNNNEVLVWRTLKWAAGMRTLAVTLPLKKSYVSSTLQVRVGVEPTALYDEYTTLSQVDSQGVVSAWSVEFNTSKGDKEAEKLVERRFKVAHRVIGVWEETGESIARHLWYASGRLLVPYANFQGMLASQSHAMWTPYSQTPPKAPYALPSTSPPASPT
jgi:hypothetical protein